MSNTTQFVQDYTLVCRTCLQQDVDMINLAHNINEGNRKISYLDCLKFCLAFEEYNLDEQEMPLKICKECASALQVTYWFMKNACQAQEVLKVKLNEMRHKKQQMEIEQTLPDMKKSKTYRCKICNVKVETKRSLKDHVKLHLDIIVYSCQSCSYESHKRDELVEHYQNIHGKDATREQLKPKTKLQNQQQQQEQQQTSFTQKAHSSTVSSASVQDNDEQMKTIKIITNNSAPQFIQPNASFSTFNAIGNNSPMIPALNQNQITQYNLAVTTAATTILTLPSATTSVPGFNTFNQNQFNLQQFQVQPLSATATSASIGNEFIVMADGSVEEVLGKGVVIEYVNASGDTVVLDNGMVLNNIMQMPNSNSTQTTTGTTLTMPQNEMVQMDVDDMIIEESVNMSEQLQVPSIIDEEMVIPASIIEPLKRVSCKICQKSFMTQELLKNHMLSHNDIPQFFCEKCSFYTFFKIDINQHYKSKHNIQANHRQLQPKNKTKLKTMSPRPTEDERKSRYTYNCDLCLFDTHFKSQMKYHYAEMHNIQATDVELRPSNIKDLGNESPASSSSSQNIAIQNSLSTAAARLQQSKLRNSPKKQQKTIPRVIAKSPEPEKPDYPNGMHCRQCHELFYWRNQLYEHYKLHNAEEAARQKQKQKQEKKMKDALMAEKTMQEQQQLQQQQQYLQQQQQQTQQHLETQVELATTSLLHGQEFPHLLQQHTQTQTLQLQPTQEKTITTNLPTTSMPDITTNNDSLNSAQTPTITTTTDFENSISIAALTPTNSCSNTNTSTFTLPLDAIPQIVETDQTIEGDTSYFDFNGDKIFGDFDDVDVGGNEDDVDLDVDDMDDEMESNDGFGNLVLTSDDDFDDMLLEQNQEQQQQQQQQSDQQQSETKSDQQTKQSCAHCQKQFLSQYQFENHMFMHRELAPYRCEMCTNLYNTKRALIRHYKAVHKKIPTRDMIQAKGDKICVETTPVETLQVEKSNVVTLMCAKCPYESTDFNTVLSHLKDSHGIENESYIIKKLPFECPRCIRSYSSMDKVLKHLSVGHSSRLIDEFVSKAEGDKLQNISDADLSTKPLCPELETLVTATAQAAQHQQMEQTTT